MTVKVISIAELKRRLSAHLETVKAGDEVIVTDRGRPVARLVPLGSHPAAADAAVSDLVRKGLARAPASAPPEDLWELPRPADPRGDARRFLLEERADGR